MEHPLFTRKQLLFFCILFLVCRMLAMWLMPIADPSEARYAAIARNMAESGDYLVPRFVHNGISQPFEGKPPLYFQMSALCCRLFGICPFAVRLPALLSALLILGFMFFTVRKLSNEPCAIMATFFCMFSGVFLAFAGFCMTDLLLAATVCCAVFSYMLFADAAPAQKQRYSILFFAFLGIGMIVKGPVALVMSGMPVFCFVLFNNRWKELKYHAWFWGILVFLLIASPWYIMMTRRQPDFLEYFFINENFKRFLFKEYGDRYGQGREAFRGVSILWGILCTLPFNLLILLPLFKRATPRHLFAKVNLQKPLHGLALLTILTITGFWCLTSRVLITYLFPIIPMVAIYVSLLLDESSSLSSRQTARTTKITCIALASFLMAGMLALSIYGDSFSDELPSNAYKRLLTMPEVQNKQIYFLRKTPYSAEFHLGTRVCNHPTESIRSSLTNSKQQILFMSDWYEEDIKPHLQKNPRKCIFKYKKWRAYAPEQ